MIMRLKCYKTKYVSGLLKIDQDMSQYHSSITISLNSEDMDGGGELCREEGRKGYLLAGNKHKVYDHTINLKTLA